MVAMALAPYLGAVAFERGGAQWTFLLLLALALSNVALVAVLWRLSRRPHVQNVEPDPVERRQ